MKTLFAVLAIFICPTFAVGDTIGPSTGSANSSTLGRIYSANLINYSGNPLDADFIVDSAELSARTEDFTMGPADGVQSLALNLSIPITDIESALDAINHWSASSFGSAPRIWQDLLTTNQSSIGENQVHLSGLASYATNDLSTNNRSFAEQVSLNESNGNDDDQGEDRNHTGSRKIPEPGSLILIGTGLLISGGLLRKLVA
jgi:hypothetical protein